MRISCSLNQKDLVGRRDRWLRLWARAGVDAVTTHNGLVLSFRSASGVKQELSRLAELERDCCAFADWSVSARGDELLLDVSAPTQDGITAVQAMLGELRPRASTAEVDTV